MTELAGVMPIELVETGVACDIPHPRPKTKERFTPESLEAESQRIATRLVERGFHTELSMSPQEYIASLPSLEMLQATLAEDLKTPLVVETRIKPKRQAELLGGRFYRLVDEKLIDWETKAKVLSQFDGPYTTWVEDGSAHLDHSIYTMRNTTIPLIRYIGNPVRGANIFEGLALYAAHPEVLEDHLVDLPGTMLNGQPGAPTMNLYNGQLSVGNRSAEHYECLRVGSAIALQFPSSPAPKQIGIE